MTIIEHDRITINAGDDVDIPVSVTYLPFHGYGHVADCGHAYDIQDEDVFSFTLYKGKCESENIVYRCSGTAGTNHIIIPASETIKWVPGRYYATIVLTTEDKTVRVWPYERPDPFGKIRKRHNFIVNSGDVEVESEDDDE